MVKIFSKLNQAFFIYVDINLIKHILQLYNIWLYLLKK